jgi:hypothetical protein
MFPAVSRQGEGVIEIERPRSTGELFGASVDLYLRVPVLFLALAAVVVVPWELIVLLITGAGPFALRHSGFVTSQSVALADSFLVTPLISALHVHAVREVADGGRPRFLPTIRRSLPALAIVALATGISWVGILVGSLIVVPGLMLWARWAVVAQTAALDGGGWTDALRRSANLTEGYRWHALGLVFGAALIAWVPSFALGAAFGHQTTTVTSFAAGTGIQIVVRSFEALVTALLYFDLKARRSSLVADGPSTSETPTAQAAETAPSDEVRPAGWYIDPSTPTRMRYWAADGSGWSQSTTKTPKAMLKEWRDLHPARPRTPAMAAEPPTAHSLDPDVYTDEARPAGWYVDPDKPWRMRYWHAGEHQAWSKETAKTPEKAQAEWRDLRWRR